MTRSILLGYAREKIALSGASRNVVFIARIAGAPVKAKFNPAEMMYRGKFAA